jgi:hypothetical protein
MSPNQISVHMTRRALVFDRYGGDTKQLPVRWSNKKGYLLLSKYYGKLSEDGLTAPQ